MAERLTVDEEAVGSKPIWHPIEQQPDSSRSLSGYFYGLSCVIQAPGFFRA